MDRPLHIPPRDTPHPQPHQDEATDLIRKQIAQIYDESDQKSGATPVQPQVQPSAQTIPPTYQQTYREEPPQPPQPDWQTYHNAWQSYYQQYYQRYYLHQLHAQKQQEVGQASPAKETPIHQPTETVTGKAEQEEEDLKKIKSRLRKDVEERAKKVRRSPHFKPLVSGLVVGLLFLLVQFNSVIAAEFEYYVSPGTKTDQGGSIIIDPTTAADIGPNPEIIIPKIGVDVPVVYGITSYDNTDIENGLENGVVHYGTTTYPGQIGNDVIVGHSSNEIYAPGNYKFAFVLLSDLDNGDVVELNYQGTRYVYQVYNKAVVSPNDFSLIDTSPSTPTLSLITCTPPGTSLNRLIVQAKQISPDPSTAAQAIPQKNSTQNKSGTLPGANAPTLLNRLTNIF
ncbi:MAG TPA: sortase [Candidatus Saccharimonadales bacterium]|nr:sortase [Candidatus Saccharimonadales bacterium]